MDLFKVIKNIFIIYLLIKLFIYYNYDFITYLNKLKLKIFTLINNKRLFIKIDLDIIKFG